MTKRTNKQYPNDFKQEAVLDLTEHFSLGVVSVVLFIK
jgi:transposase-like protein